MERTLTNTQREDLSGVPTGAPTPMLYVVLEGERPLAGGLRASLERVKEVRIGRGTKRTWRVDESGVATLEIPDPRMSSRHARLVAEDGAFILEDLGSTNGTFVAGARIETAAIDEDTLVTMGATVLALVPAEQVPETLQPVLDSVTLRERPRGVATLVPAVELQMPRLVRVAMAKLPVLLLGESGVGKEVLARTIHAVSGRSGPFVAINCGALAPSLVESQLFGHVKGAFSGALRDEPGLVRAAHGGTLFLDEIGELPAPAQATLLRVLQEREVLPVGATKPIAVDLRVVAATLKPIDQSPTFRPDLYARVAAFVHRIAPVRERRADLGIFIADLLPRLAPERAASLRLAPDFATALAAHAWPMNVRELEHVLSVALVTSSEPLLRLEHAGDALRPVRASERPPLSGGKAPRRSDPGPLESEQTPSGPPARAARPLTADEQRLREDLLQALTRTQGNVSEVARTMGKTRMQIHRWMKRFGITPESFRTGG